MLCSISGTVAKEPVVSKKSGHIFERKLIEKVIRDTGLCPVTNEILDVDDLVEVQGGNTQVSRPESACSVPGLLTLLQNEWDSAVLELYQTRKSLQETRQELSHALYQQDAATRVIARLIREREEYRKRLESSEKKSSDKLVKEPRDDEGASEHPQKKARMALDASVIEAMTKTSKELSVMRKDRKISDTVASIEDIEKLESQGGFPVHATRKGGILSIAVCPSSSLVATAGADSTVHIVDTANISAGIVLKGHAKRVTDVQYATKRGTWLSCSGDGTVRLWQAEDDTQSSYNCQAVIEHADVVQSKSSKKAKPAEVVSVQVHPTNDYFFSAAGDGSWCMFDLERQERLVRVGVDETDPPPAYSAAALHPDGLIYCTGSEQADIKVWEARNQKPVASFVDHSGAIKSISFSENGYYMASAAEDGVKVWDLRKLKSIQSLEPKGTGATCVSFDHSGQFLAVGGAGVSVYGVKAGWSVLKEISDFPKKGVHSLTWGSDAKELFVGASDHNLRVFSCV